MSVADSILSLSLAAANMTTDRGFWMPEGVSTVSDDVDFAFNVVTWIAEFFFVLIVVLMAWFVIKYRRVPGRAAEQTATHHTPLELTWTIVPLMLVIVIFYVGMTAHIGQRTAPVDVYEVTVTGQKWYWNFEHRNGCMEANVLRVPVNRPVQLIMSSEDVLHSMFIPAFRVKQDVVPGRYASIWFEATRTGTFDLYCTEYCGTGHSQMVGQVIVYEEDDFEMAMRECREWPDRVADAGLPYIGANFYNRCQSCHSLDGSVRIGPSFRETHENWGQERTMTDGSRVTVDENYIRESLLDPRAHVVAGYPNTMPSFQGQLSERQLRAMIEFIKRLDEIELDDRGSPVLMTPDEMIEQFGGNESAAEPAEEGQSAS